MTTTAPPLSAAPDPTGARYRRGLVLTLVGALILVPDTVLIRLSGLEVLPLMAWRGLLGAAALFAWSLATARARPGRYTEPGTRAIRASRPTAGRGMRDRIARWGPTMAFAVCYAGSTLLFVGAVSATSVTSVVVVLAAVPMGAGLLARVALKQRMDPATGLAILVCSAGLALVSLGDIGGGRGVGLALAFGAAALIAVYLTLIQAFPDRIAIAPATGLGMLLSGLVGLASAGLVLPPEPARMVWVVLNSAVVVPLSFGLLLSGPRVLPAAEVGLIMLLETVLAPLLVWVVLGESPGRLALIGGAIVVAALVGHGLLRLRASAPLPPSPPATPADARTPAGGRGRGRDGRRWGGVRPGP